MKIVQEDFSVRTTARNQMIDITSTIRSIVAGSGIRLGDVVVHCPHTTAAITINENADPSVGRDMLMTLEQLIPQMRPGYRHSEGNSDAHCKSSLFGCTSQILVRDADLDLGTWQGVFFCEFDGPRSRRVVVQVRGQ